MSDKIFGLNFRYLENDPNLDENERKGGEYGEDLYEFLMFKEDKHEYKQIFVQAYERKMKELGLTPETELIKERAFRNIIAIQAREEGFKNLFFYDQEAVDFIIENKNRYYGVKVDLQFLGIYTELENQEGRIVGIGKKSIAIEDEKKNKEFFWYLPKIGERPKGFEIAKYLIIYGEE